MTDREKLIKLIRKGVGYYFTESTEPPIEEYLADYLLANGVIVPPCKVGDTMWVVWSYTKSQKQKVYPAKVYALRYDDKKNSMRVCVEGTFKMDKYDGYYYRDYRGTFSWQNVGKTVFLTKEEAEKALAERN